MTNQRREAVLTSLPLPALGPRSLVPTPSYPLRLSPVRPFQDTVARPRSRLRPRPFLAVWPALRLVSLGLEP